MALEYRPAPASQDATTAAASEAATSGGSQLLPAVADRLRKQAKGRAVLFQTTSKVFAQLTFTSSKTQTTLPQSSGLTAS